SETNRTRAISPSPSAPASTWPPQLSTGERGCGPLLCCASSALPSPATLILDSASARRRSCSLGVQGGLPTTGVISPSPSARGSAHVISRSPLGCFGGPIPEGAYGRSLTVSLPLLLALAVSPPAFPLCRQPQL